MYHGLEMATHGLYVVFLIIPAACGSEYYRQGGFTDTLSNGMKFASDFLASDSIASKVAEFVVRAFQTANNPTPSVQMPPPMRNAYVEDSRSDENFADENRPNSQVNEAPTPMAPLKYLVKFLGLQPNQISAVAVNALVFVAQMISTFLAGPTRPTNPYRTEDPTNWILNKNSRALQDLITTAKNGSIMEDIDDLIKKQGEETSCIRLLVCRITPFVRKMQTAVFGKNTETNSEDRKLRGSDVMYGQLPSADEIRKSSDICEQTHRDCDLNDV